MNISPLHVDNISHVSKASRQYTIQDHGRKIKDRLARLKHGRTIRSIISKASAQPYHPLTPPSHRALPSQSSAFFHLHHSCKIPQLIRLSRGNNLCRSPDPLPSPVIYHPLTSRPVPSTAHPFPYTANRSHLTNLPETRPLPYREIRVIHIYQE